METKEPKAMREIHEIRERLFENEKKMGSRERLDMTNKIADDFVKKYHLDNRIIKELIHSN